MVESDFNSLVVKSLNNQGGFGYKIPDTFSVYSKQRNKAPYDIFGYYKGRFVCCESKWLQKPQSFPFTRLEDHQIENLLKAHEMVENSLSLFLIGVDFGRNDKRVFVWKNTDLYNIDKRKKEKDNIYKKEFESLQNYVKIEKGQVDFEKIISLGEDK